jgi:hypothetical protein
LTVLRRGTTIRAPTGALRLRHCPSLNMTMDVHPSRTVGIRLHRVTAAKIEPIRGDRARPAGTRLD